MPTLKTCEISPSSMGRALGRTTSTSPQGEATMSKKSPKAKATARRSPAKNPAAASPLSKRQPPSTTILMSPSPYQVVSDLIDATCHEILNLGGNDPESFPPIASYIILAQRLDYYMEQMDSSEKYSDEEEPDFAGYDDGTPPLLKDAVVRCRLMMAKMVIDVCARMAYPEVFVATSQSKQPTSNLPALIHMSEFQWFELRKELGQLQCKVQIADGNVDPSFESVNCQIEAMEALAKLRNELRNEMNKGDGIKSISPASFAILMGPLDKYKASSNTINGKLQDIRQTSYTDLFVPHQMLSLERCSTVKGVKDAMTSLIESVDDMVTKKVFPLQNFQVQFLKLLKGWEKYHLSPPKLFRIGYFRHHGESASNLRASSTSAQMSPAEASKSPRQKSPGRGRPRKATEIALSNDGDESETLHLNRLKSQKRRHSPARNDDETRSHDELLSQTQSFLLNELKSQKRRQSPARNNDHDECDSSDGLLSQVQPSTRKASTNKRKSPARKAKSLPTSYNDDKEYNFLSGNEGSDSPDELLSQVQPSPRKARGNKSKKSPARKTKSLPIQYNDDFLPENDESDSPDELLSQVQPSSRKARGNKRKKSPARKTKSSPIFYDYDPDYDFLTGKKKRVRVPYSEEEKSALLEGVKKFGIGKWVEILDEYDEIFSENKRTNVNLKDLYRTLKPQRTQPFDLRQLF